LKKALKKLTNVKKIKRKSYTKKREKLNRSIGKNWTQLRVSVCQAVWIDRGDPRACIHG